MWILFMNWWIWYSSLISINLFITYHREDKIKIKRSPRSRKEGQKGTDTIPRCRLGWCEVKVFWWYLHLHRLKLKWYPLLLRFNLPLIWWLARYMYAGIMQYKYQKDRGVRRGRQKVEEAYYLVVFILCKPSLSGEIRSDTCQKLAVLLWRANSRYLTSQMEIS